MATTRTYPFTVSTPPHTVRITDNERGEGVVSEYQGEGNDPHENLAVRVIRAENELTGVTSGTLTISAA